MIETLWLVPAVPIVSFAALAILGHYMTSRLAAVIGVGAIGISAGLALAIAGELLLSSSPEASYRLTLWTWIDVGQFQSTFTLYLDALSLVMMLVVTCVGFLIHLYSAEFMAEDDGYTRFFAYMNLFVAAMLLLVLADDLLVLYLGWEGVGLCSYLLIGFWYEDPANGSAARKAFLVTRIGDAGMAVGLLLIFHNLQTLQIQEGMRLAVVQWPIGSLMASAAATLLLAGALGKSAQLPLQTWLPDAMAGPTPTSALIHAATMVTAGVYLIARTHSFFELAPQVMNAVAVIGAVTLVVAGCSALVQRDIKRVLAYSTISQVGYMFLALGVGAWSAAIFHFMTHAFFKALLFLSAGAVILAVHHEHDMFKMGGLRRQLPVPFWTMLIGAASLAAVPWMTAGFYSKEAILLASWRSPQGSPWLWAFGVIGALITALYAFRLIFLVFFGPPRQAIEHRPGFRITIPLLALAVLALVAGFVQLPLPRSNQPALSQWLEASSLPSEHLRVASIATEISLEAIAIVASLMGVYLAYRWFLRKPQELGALVRSELGSAIRRFWLSGWGFDWIYQRVFVKPFYWAVESNKNDVLDRIYAFIAGLNLAGHIVLRDTETGRLRWHAAGIVLGVVIGLALILLFFAPGQAPLSVSRP